MIRNILVCFHGDGCRCRQWSRAGRMSCPKNGRSACSLGQSRGCSLPHPGVMGQVLVSAPPGCSNHGIWYHHFLANRWGNGGNCERLYVLVFQNHCRWWLQPWNLKTLAPWKKTYDKPRQHIKKQRHYFANKGHTSQTMVFLVVTYGCKSWTIKKADHQRIDAFELWCWRRLLRVPWTARRSNQSTLKEISPGYSLEGLMLNLQYFGHLMQRTNSLEKTLMLGKIEGGRRRGCQRMRWLDGIMTHWT